jgi:hypothetical protein
MEDILYNNQPQAWNETKDVGELDSNRSNKQIFWGNGGGHRQEQEGVTKQEINRKNTDRRIENEEAWKSALWKHRRIKVSLQSTMRKRLRKMAIKYQLKKRRGGIWENKCSAISCALHCYLIYSFPSSC